MDGTLKALVGAACIAVIAAAGFYFYSEYSAARTLASRQASVDHAMSWLYRLAEAKEGDTKRVAQFCSFVRTEPSMRESAEKLGAPEACRTAGF